MSDFQKHNISALPKSGANRQFQRKQLLDVAAMLWDDNNNPPLEATCRDISTSGMLVELQQELAIGIRLRVSLHNQQNRQHLTSLQTRVMRIQKNKWGGFTAGLEIIREPIT